MSWQSLAYRLLEALALAALRGIVGALGDWLSGKKPLDAPPTVE